MPASVRRRWPAPGQPGEARHIGGGIETISWDACVGLNCRHSQHVSAGPNPSRHVGDRPIRVVPPQEPVVTCRYWLGSAPPLERRSRNTEAARACPVWVGAAKTRLRRAPQPQLHPIPPLRCCLEITSVLENGRASVLPALDEMMFGLRMDRKSDRAEDTCKKPASRGAPHG